MDGPRVYVDASVVLRKLLHAPGATPRWGGWSVAEASELIQVESVRTLDRLRVLGELTVVQFASCVEALTLLLSASEPVPLHHAVLRRAGCTFAMPIGTLDAIHLSTALLWMELRSQDLTFLTHDRQPAMAARASGLKVQFTR